MDPSKYRKETLQELRRLISSHDFECTLVRKRQRQKNTNETDTAQEQEETSLPTTPNRKRKQAEEHGSNEKMKPDHSTKEGFFVRKKRIIESPSPERSTDSCDSPKKIELNIKPIANYQQTPMGLSSSESEDDEFTENTTSNRPTDDPTNTAEGGKSTQSDDDAFMENVIASRPNKQFDTSNKPRIKITKKKMATSTKTSKKRSQKNCQCKGKCNKACGCRKQGRICTAKCTCMATCNNSTT
jgi:hypothetical protein